MSIFLYLATKCYTAQTIKLRIPLDRVPNQPETIGAQLTELFTLPFKAGR